MELDCVELKLYLKAQLDGLQSHLPLRVCFILEDLLSSDIDGKEKMDIFDLLVRLLLKADQEAAEVISNLLVPLNTEGSYQLDDHTISRAGSFLRDFLKKDYLLCVLGSEKRIKPTVDGEERER